MFGVRQSRTCVGYGRSALGPSHASRSHPQHTRKRSAPSVKAGYHMFVTLHACKTNISHASDRAAQYTRRDNGIPAGSFLTRFTVECGVLMRVSNVHDLFVFAVAVFNTLRLR